MTYKADICVLKIDNRERRSKSMPTRRDNP